MGHTGAPGMHSQQTVVEEQGTAWFVSVVPALGMAGIDLNAWPTVLQAGEAYGAAARGAAYHSPAQVKGLRQGMSVRPTVACPHMCWAFR